MESQHLCGKEITLQILHQKQFLVPILLYYFMAKILLTDPDLYHIDLSHGSYLENLREIYGDKRKLSDNTSTNKIRRQSRGWMVWCLLSSAAATA